MGGHECEDALLHIVEIPKGLGRADDGTADADGMDGHGGRGDDEGPLARHRQGHPNGVASPPHESHRGLLHGGDQLSQSQPRLHVPAHGVEDHQKAVKLVILLHRDQKGDQLLVFGGLLSLGEDVMPLDLADDGQAVDGLITVFHRHRGRAVNGLQNLLGLAVGGFVFRRGGSVFGVFHG